MSHELDDVNDAFVPFEHSRIVGRGDEDFGRARERLLGWAVQRAAGIRVLDAPDRVVSGSTVRLRIRILGVPIDAPVQVWSVIDEPWRAGFTYTTLPGHPEEGVEEFLLELLAGEEVRFTIRGRSRHATWWSRLGGPVSRWVQRRTTERYLGALSARVGA